MGASLAYSSHLTTETCCTKGTAVFLSFLLQVSGGTAIRKGPEENFAGELRRVSTLQADVQPTSAAHEKQTR